MDVTFQVVKAEDITGAQKAVVATLLQQQGKVRPPYENKAERCKIVCFALANGKPFAMGAIKKKTASVFLSDRANQPDLSDTVDDELGYIFNSRTDIKGIGKKIVSRLLKTQASKCLMATTEIDANPRMVNILQSFGFQYVGTPWIGDIHDNLLGLFIRKGQNRRLSEQIEQVILE